MANLCARWFEHCKTPEEKKELEAIIRGSLILPLLENIVEKDMRELDRLQTSDYDSPNWSHKQADKNGQLKVLRNMKTLVTLGRNDPK